MNIYDKKLLEEMRGTSSKGSSFLLLTIIIVISGLIMWSYVTELDVVVRGQGKTVSRGSNEMLQAAESGVIVSTFVEEGDLIQQGQVVFKLDLIEIKGQIQQLNDKIKTLKVRSERLTAEAENKKFLPDKNVDPKLLEIILSEQSLYDANIEQKKASLAVLESQKNQKKSEIIEITTEVESIQNNLELLLREIAVVEPLVISKLAPETRLLALQRDKENLTGKLKLVPETITRIEQGIEEIDQRMISEKKSFIADKINQLGNIKMEIDELQSRIPSLSDKLDRSTIKSPINGVVNRITHKSDDAFVRAGDVLMEVVPINDELIVEGKIDPKDIAKINPGDAVKISLTAYDASKFGRIDGTVLKISADVIADKDSGSQYYLVDTSIDGKLEKSNGGDYTVLPGMVGTIEILAGKRTILDYFWQPIVKGRDAAFRE